MRGRNIEIFRQHFFKRRLLFIIGYPIFLWYFQNWKLWKVNDQISFRSRKPEYTAVLLGLHYFFHHVSIWLFHSTIVWQRRWSVTVHQKRAKFTLLHIQTFVQKRKRNCVLPLTFPIEYHILRVYMCVTWWYLSLFLRYCLFLFFSAFFFR